MPDSAKRARPGHKKVRGKGIHLPGLKRAREDAGYSVRDLEAATIQAGLKVHRTTISGLENGHHGAWPKTVKRLSDVLGVPVAKLRGEE